MSSDAASFAARMVDHMAVTDPELDTSIGSEPRKVIDMLAEQLAEISMDKDMLSYRFDIDSKVGADLDEFCLVPGTPVLTPGGVRPIESLNPGDEVVTHTGATQCILATSDREVEEEVVTLRTGIGVEHTMTKNHPVLVTKKGWLTMVATQWGNYTRRSDFEQTKDRAFRLRGLGNKTVWDRDSISRDWVPAGEVELGDIVWGPAPSRFVGDRREAITEDELRLIGWYLAEGHTHENGEIGFTLNTTEIEAQDEIERLIKSVWGIEYVSRRFPHKSSVQVICRSKNAVRWLRDRFGHGAGGKRIAQDLFESREDLTPLLAAMWEGDGSSQKSQTFMQYGTSSATLASQVFELLTRMGLTPRLEKAFSAGDEYHIEGRTGTLNHDHWTVSVRGRSAEQLADSISYPLPRRLVRADYAPPSFRDGDFIGSAVVAVTTSVHEGHVHNIEVEGDNSYVLMGNFGVHNCAMFGFTRFSARRAQGVVTLYRPSAAPQSIFIPAGTQVSTASVESAQVFATVGPAWMARGTASVEIPVQAVVGGTGGNLPANSLVLLINGVEDLSSSCTNYASTTGGADEESDEALIARFKRTVFRSLAGTECQPPGTQVLVPNPDGRKGSRPVAVPIESIQPGDRVCSYKQGYVIRSGREVLGITSRHYEGDLIVVRTQDGRESRYTPNHKCLVRMGPALEDKHIVYLQRRGDSFRIGTTTGGWMGASPTGTRGIVSRLKDQDADAGWILSAHDSRDEALLAEMTASWRFNIPMSLFIGNKMRTDGSQARLDEFWSEVGDLTDQAERCLEHFGRLLAHPLITRATSGGEPGKRVWSRTGIVHATNLFDGCELVEGESMAMSTLASPPVEYAPISVYRERYSGPVWSMEVADEATYVADGLVTHNSMFLGVALEHDPVAVSSGTAPTQAAVVGVASKWREQIQIEANGRGRATIPADNVKYVFEDSFVLGTDIESGQIFSQGVHYTVDTSTMPPTIQSISLENGAIYDLEFEYTSSASRNDPGAGISNRIDVWVNGENLVEAGEAFTFSPTRTFSDNADADLYRGKFIRLNTPGQNPGAGNVFTQLSYGPIHSFPDLLTIAGTEFRERVDYFIVHDDSAFGYGPTSRHGIEWVGTPPMQGAQVGVTYWYNHIPTAVEARIRRWRLVGTDARAHAGKAARLRPNFAIMYDRGASISRVNTAVFQALSRFMNSRGFGAQVQISDMLHVVSGVTGVDNVRLARQTDSPTDHGIEEVTATGIRIKTWTTDVLLRDDQMPVLHDVRLIPRAQNTIY